MKIFENSSKIKHHGQNQRYKIETQMYFLEIVLIGTPNQCLPFLLAKSENKLKLIHFWQMCGASIDFRCGAQGIPTFAPNSKISNSTQTRRVYHSISFITARRMFINTL